MADKASNSSYKDQYHFKRSYFPTPSGNLPSLNGEPDINTTIKKNPYRTNVEIEKDEIILEPDMSALYKARGKKHSGGGIDVNLKPDSFVFSDDKSLKFDDDDIELFELKGKGNTPARVLKRNIDLEHYNRLVNNIEDPTKDDLAKKSSTMMLEKYIETLGNIAYVQEGKKRFPQGLPPFSQGTAPVYDVEVKEEVDSAKQFAKFGGAIMQKGGNWGLWKGDRLPIFKKRFGVSNAADKISDLSALAKQLGYSGPQDNASFQKWLYNSSPENKAVIDKWHTQYDEPNIGRPSDQRNRFDGKIGIRWQNILQELTGQKRPPLYADPVNPDRPDTTIGEVRPPVPDPTGIPSNDTPAGNPGYKSADWELTPWQKLSLGYNASKYAGAKRYMPMRSHINPTYADPALVNPEQTIGDLRGTANTQMRSLNTLNPILRNAQAAGAYGQLLDQLPGVRSQYDNQNAQITNQFRMTNNQTRNNATAMNSRNDQEYYQQTINGQQNFDNMKSFLGEQYMNELMGDVQQNQSLAYNMLTQNNPAYRYDWKTGKLVRNPKNIMDAATNGKGDLLSEYLGKISGDWDKLDNKDRINLLKIMTAKGFTPTTQKKGGRVNPYK